MHVLVTGGAGFLGSALVDRLLAEGHQVDVVDNLRTGSLANLAEARKAAGRDLTFHQLDVRSDDVAQLIRRRPPEVIWHLAAHTSVADSVTQAALDADINIVGTLNVLDAASAAGCRKVVAASNASAVYGATDRYPSRESDRRQPRSPHGVAKHAVDAYLAAFRELQGLEFTSLVMGKVYGPRDALGVVGIWARSVVSGQPCLVEGSGAQTRDFLFVDDAVDALARAAEHGDGLILNVGTGVETSLTRLHGLLLRAAADAGLDVGAATLLAGPGRPEDVERSCLDSTRAGLYLDWRAWTPLADGLTTVVAATEAATRAGPGGPAGSAEEIFAVGPDDLGSH